ncbi:hypothetical protein WL73_23350 [Burkholderia ubonensis]|uniref:Uncharacterized protein n=1 Tax=Burkholderia ubonensis TaxID=101571 RepID=A0A107FMV5_9BURK|nr:hypothetical protein WL73_23350 [Burkholderia ubonensis]
MQWLLLTRPDLWMHFGRHVVGLVLRSQAFGEGLQMSGQLSDFCMEPELAKDCLVPKAFRLRLGRHQCNWRR